MCGQRKFGVNAAKRRIMIVEKEGKFDCSVRINGSDLGSCG